jgi:dTDP-4-dehydrorhamnose reductase
VRVLITGAGGQLGRELVRTAPAAATVRALDRTYLDVTDAAAVQAVVGEYQPTVILNAAGYTAVDRAESDQEAAWRLNAVAPRQLAEAARTVQQCRLIHVSTDYVFDGESPRPYQPQDAPNPLSAYGKSKLEGERAVLEVLGNHSVVVRTAWVYSAHGRNFLHTMLRLMREQGVVRVVADQIGSPTATASLAEMLWACAERPGLTGIFHWTDAGVASWYDFAVAIAEEANGRRLLAAPAQVLAIASDDYPTPARRPRCSLLDRRSTIAAVGLEPEHWRVRLRGVLDELTRG